MTTVRRSKMTHGLLIASLLGSGAAALASGNDERGLMPALRMDTKSEDENDKRALQTELLITRAEMKAIESLQKIIQKKRGLPEEAELQHRLAELYMRRARTGRFFDLHQDMKTMRISSFPTPQEKGFDWIRKAAVVYADVEKRFPKYEEMDSILFNDAFAHQQLGQIQVSQKLYQQLIDKIPKSRLVPDSSVALGELFYDQGHFDQSLKYFQIVRKYPEHKVYTYAIYKEAWAHYNMKDSQGGIASLLDVLKACPADAKEADDARRQNLRKEALHDLALFVSDAKPATELFAFFKQITTDEELGAVMGDLSKIFLSHGRLKEMNQFISQFVDSHPDHSSRVKLMLSLAEAEETQHRRDQVVTLLEKVGTLCRPDSAWRIQQTPLVITESCTEAFPAKVHEVAAKWWEIWEKNKNHAEFSDLTEKVLKVILDNEDPQNPDLASRFADAELLFQRGRFKEASEQYALTADKIAANPKAKVATNVFHDSDYGALFATEKALEQAKTEEMVQRQKKLAEIYIQRQPQGLHVAEVTLRLAVIAFEGKQYDASLKRLEKILIGEGGRELQRKAEDLDLEILNVQQNYALLNAHVSNYIKREKSEERLASLKKIELEASYAGLQSDLKKVKSVEASQRLKVFAEGHSGNKLADDALFQSAALDFLEGRGLAAGESITRLYSQNPSDPRLISALLDSARAAAEAGEMSKAADFLKLVAEKDKPSRLKNLELAADFLKMDGKVKESRELVRTLITDSIPTERPRLLTKLLESYKNEPNSPEIPKLENLILSQNIEPFATQVYTRRAQALLAAGEATKAFEAARKIVARDVPGTHRAEARLIQAQILEGELIRQSVKSSKEDKFALVLAMKTEKLDKAQTAYLSASRMTTDVKLLSEAFSGIDRCQGNFIESLQTVKPPESLSESDQQALKNEIAKLLEPIRKQHEDNRKEIRRLASVPSEGKHTAWSDLPPDQSPVPAIPSQWNFLKPYVAKVWSENPTQLERLTGSKLSCDPKKPEFAPCFLKGNLEIAKTLARDLTQTKATRVEGWHHLALIADQQGLREKAIWLLKQAQTEAPNHPLVNFEKDESLPKSKEPPRRPRILPKF